VIRVFLIRHGESESNAGFPSADPGSAPLTPDGHRQARQIAQALADTPGLIVTSPYLRARQTAQPMISRFPAAACQQMARPGIHLPRRAARTHQQRHRTPAIRPGVLGSG
jgi:broad specificity phosphatase PhoE